MVVLLLAAGLALQEPAPREDGYRGIWFTLGQRSKHGDKYSGGLGTYTAKHAPLAVYSPRVEKTFFVYGGTRKGKRHLLAMVSYYDHAKGRVPRPVMVHDKEGVNDPHDNPSLCLDDRGHLWVFVAGRSRKRDGFIYRSFKPFDIGTFERVRTHKLMAYPQPWNVPGKGFVYLFTHYTNGRELYWETFRGGKSWSPERKLAGFGGHYQVSGRRGETVVTAFSWHPGGSVDRRTNLYFVQTDDFGRTWKTAAGRPVETPMASRDNSALVRDYHSEKRLVYLKDINFDRSGRPVILYITSGNHQPGPQDPPRTWMTARWSGKAWEFRRVTTSTHNYDMGSLYVEPDGTWRIIAPTEPGPQRWGSGGEMALWSSLDEGRTWSKVREVTRNSTLNHGYARRPVDAHPDFHAFWADGNPDKFSESRLYFTNRTGARVWRLPEQMSGEFAKPEVVGR